MKDLLKFFPLLLLYFFLVLTRGQSALFGDEIRYFAYAENLTQGFYTTPDNPNLINGPGYPLYLAAFVALNLPPLAPKMVSAVLFFFAIIFFYKSLLFYLPKRGATLFAYALGLYWPMLIRLQWNNTEPLALFLLCGFIYFIIKMTRSPKNKIIHIILAAMMVGYLALTRDIFSYVILVTLILSLIYYLITKNKPGLKWALSMGLGFLFVLPYLVYTHSLTGRHFYFSSNGGEQLYWMSSSLPGEFGSFISIDSIYERRGHEVDSVHVQFIDSIFQLPYVERNDALIARAKENILENPKGYLKNIIANILRLVGHGPSSFEYQVWATYKYLFTHFLLLAPFLLSLFPAWIHRKSIPPEIFFLSLFILIYLGGSILVAAISRYFVLTIPFILLWLAFFYTYMIQFSFVNKWQKNGDFRVKP
ncbi:MAG: hypothetical protein KDC85_07385 [Saprospiraceae bacterium]|nr:hypothetical protein [Saprospiraceae bacterium]